MHQNPKLSIQRRRLANVLVVELGGDLTGSAQAARLRQELEGLLDPSAPSVLLNLTDVRYMDSTAVCALLAAKASANTRNIDLKLCCAPSLVTQLLKQLRLSGVLEIHEDEPSAIAAFSKK